MTDAELIVASCRDPAAFHTLYARWAETLLAYFYRRVYDAEVAADLLAETTWPRTDLFHGTCGTVSGPGGSPERTISGAIDEEHHRIMIFAEPPRAAQDKAMAFNRLVDGTGARCWGLDELRERVRREASGLGFTVAFTVYDAPGAVATREDGTRERFTEGVELFDARRPLEGGLRDPRGRRSRRRRPRGDRGADPEGRGGPVARTGR